MESIVIPETFELGEIQLRRPRISDLNAIYEYASDLSVAKYMDWPVETSLDALEQRLRKRRSLWDSAEEYYWAIAAKENDYVIGGISLRVGTTSAEIGYLLNKLYWNHGYITKAARTILDWAFSTSTLYRIWATCDTGNIASIRVLEKIGMQKEGLLRKYLIRPNLSEIPRDAYLYARVRE